MLHWKTWTGICVLLFFNVLTSAFAVENAKQSSAMLKDDFEQTFQHMLKDPGNVDVTLRYSHLASELGNYEAAIPPLERLLMFNPDLPDIKLKLGELYHKLGSDEMARTYFEDAKKGNNVPSHVISEANNYLKKL